MDNRKDNRKARTASPARRAWPLIVAGISVTTGMAIVVWNTHAAPAEPSALPASGPATNPAPLTTQTGDWPAFHGGGGLRGEGKPTAGSGAALEAAAAGVVSVIPRRTRGRREVRRA